jgi:hypothetical protein
VWTHLCGTTTWRTDDVERKNTLRVYLRLQCDRDGGDLLHYELFGLEQGDRDVPYDEHFGLLFAADRLSGVIRAVPESEVKV